MRVNLVFLFSFAITRRELVMKVQLKVVFIRTKLELEVFCQLQKRGFDL